MNGLFHIVQALTAQDIPAAAILVERCVCCWQVAHPDQPYPLAWSSTLCPEHASWTRQRYADRKGTRR